MGENAHKIWVKVKGERFLVEVTDLDQRPIIAVVEGSRFEVYPELESEDSNDQSDPQETLFYPEKQYHKKIYYQIPILSILFYHLDSLYYFHNIFCVNL